MSYADPNNPFQSPQAPNSFPTVPSGAAPDYFRMYSYVFDNPNWGMNLFWGFLCTLSTGIIPVVGQLVFMGYQFEVIDALLASQGRSYPDFNINRFGDYLGRSIWPFLVKLIASFAIIPVMLVLVGIPTLILFLIASSGGDDVIVIALLIGVPLILLITVPFTVLITMVLVPMAFRAGMTGSLGEGFHFEWIKDYLRRVWWELFLATFFLIISGIVLVTCGLVLCYLPAFAAMALMLMAEAHLMYQIYVLYLARGGQPVPPRPIMPLPPGPIPPAAGPSY